LSLWQEGEEIGVLHVEEAKRLYEALDACLDLRDALEQGETVAEWKQRSGQAHWLFHPGSVVATPGATEALARAQVSPTTLLMRHLSGDWGEVGEEDKEANTRALLEGNRLLSSYSLPADGATLWIITEWDRSVTTLLLPEEY
jgi:hypothetical protein